MTLWWLSFADVNRPKGQQFLGACVVEGADIKAAIKEAWALEINPGGEVAFAEIFPEQEHLYAECKNRLLDRDEALAIVKRPI